MKKFNWVYFIVLLMALVVVPEVMAEPLAVHQSTDVPTPQGSAFRGESENDTTIDDTGRPAVTGERSGGPWDAIEWVERRYKIEAMRFKARDETGIDYLGSDEVMVETEDLKGDTVSDEIGNIDSGDTYNFDPLKSCIVAVRPGLVVLGKTSVCDEVGEPAPLGFGVEFWEQDLFGIPHGFCVHASTPTPGRHSGPHCANGDGDDFIGSRWIDLTSHDLEAVLSKVGDEYIETVRLGGCEGGVDACGSAFGPDYTFTYRITRLPDVRVRLRAVLDEAKKRSGARSDLEAIAAGLRSLRAPSPREFDQSDKEKGGTANP